MKNLVVDGEKFNFLEFNQDKKDCLLFLHGNSHSLNTFSHQMSSPKLQNFRLIFVDMPGHGDSFKSQDYSLTKMAKSIYDFMSAMECDNIIIVGHSLGGHVAINMLKYLAPAGLFLFGTPPLKNPFAAEAFLPNNNAIALGKTEASFEEIEMLVNEMNYRDEQKQTAMADYLRTDSTFRQVIFTDIIAGSHSNECDLIKSFDGEVKFLLATKDSLINNNYILNEFSSSGQEFAEIEAGHSPHVEMPDLFNKNLSEFSIKVFNNRNLNNIHQHESFHEQRN